MKTLLISLAMAATAIIAQAQPEGGGNPPGGRTPGGGPGGPGPDGGRRPVPPLLAALDADKNGELSAEEIANAVTALKTLDKDGDGKISKEELRPAMPPRPEGGGAGNGEGPRGPRPEGGPRGEGKPPRDGRPGPGGPPPADR